MTAGRPRKRPANLPAHIDLDQTGTHMPTFILHHNGAYQLYTTIADGPCYESALTLDELTHVIGLDGRHALAGLPARLERARKTGCSAFDYTLDEIIECNRAGENESTVPRDEFIRRWLTLPVAGSE